MKHSTCSSVLQQFLPLWCVNHKRKLLQYSTDITHFLHSISFHWFCYKVSEYLKKEQLPLLYYRVFIHTFSQQTEAFPAARNLLNPSTKQFLSSVGLPLQLHATPLELGTVLNCLPLGNKLEKKVTHFLACIPNWYISPLSWGKTKWPAKFSYHFWFPLLCKVNLKMEPLNWCSTRYHSSRFLVQEITKIPFIAKNHPAQITLVLPHLQCLICSPECSAHLQLLL